MEHFTAASHTVNVKVVRLSSIDQRFTVKSSGKYYSNFHEG